MEPPGLSETKGQGQEGGLGGQLIHGQEAALAQQRLALLQRPAHAADGVQDIGREDDVIAPNAVALRTFHTHDASAVSAAQLILPDYSEELPDVSGRWYGIIVLDVLYIKLQDLFRCAQGMIINVTSLWSPI